jgi:hypothetical protein
MPSYVANKKQALAHKAFMSDGYKRGVLFWGRQSGKTYFAVNHIWISALLKQGLYGIVYKTYRQAHDIAWKQYVPMIPKELIYKKNEQELEVTLNYIKDTDVKLPDGTTITINQWERKTHVTTNHPKDTIVKKKDVQNINQNRDYP